MRGPRSFGYTSDRSLASSVTRKRHQRNLLAHFLLTAGLTLPSNCPPNHLTLLPPLTCHLMISPPRLTHLCPCNSPDLSSRIHMLLISSTTGVLYQPISASLSLLGDASRLLRSLNIHSVRCAMSILKARRQLEHDPLTFANHPRYTEPSFASSSTS